MLRHYCHFHLLSVGGEDAFGGKHVAPSKLRQQVDQAGAAEAHWRCPANGLVEGLAIRAEADGLDRAVAGWHPIAHQSALERRPRRAGGGEQAAPVLEHDLGVGAHVHEHRRLCVREPLFQRHQCSRRITAHVARDQREPIDPRLAVGAETQAPGQRRKRRVGALAREKGVLDGGFVGLLPNSLHGRA